MKKVKTNYKLLPFLIISIFLNIINIIPQNINYDNLKDISFSSLSREDGLSQASILTIYQDHKGFLWFGTEDGLNKYDGKNFYIYRYNFEDKNSISNSYIKCITEDHNNNLWIGTGGGGLNLFDRDKEVFISFKHEPKNENSLCNNNILSLHVDEENNIWIGTENGLNKYDGKNFYLYKNNPEDKNSISDNYINCIIEDSDNDIWFGTGEGGLNKYIKKTNSFIYYKHDPKNKLSISSNLIYSMFEDSECSIWIGTAENGLDKFNKKTGIFTHYVNKNNDTGSISSNTIKCIFEDSKKNLWIGTYEGGLNLFNKYENNFYHYQHNPLKKSCISDNNITCLFEDRSGIIWVGTYAGGVNKIDYNKMQFKKFLSISNDSNSLCNGNVWAITEDKQDRIWIGTSNGLSVYNKKRKTYKHYKKTFSEDSLTNNYIFSLLLDSQNNIWVGTLEGLNLYNESTDSFTHNFNCDFDIDHFRIFYIYEDSRNNLWFGTHNGLILYTREKKSFTLYQHDSDNPYSLSHNLCWAIQEDFAGNIWIGTINGLNKFDRAQNKFYRFYNDPENVKSLSYNLIMCIYKDKIDNLWIGTWGGGLNKYDHLNNIFTRYSEKNGLANNVVYGILGDRDGNLWMSTNEGISKFNPETKEFRNYDISDGLICNEFNGRAFYKNKDEEFYFGCIEGLISFNPDELFNYNDSPEIVITDFKVLNKSVKVSDNTFFKRSIEEIKNIVLPYKENVFSFEFAALHYSAPEKNQYAYQLKGFDKDWIYCGNRSFVTYTNLNPGKYLFKVKGANKDNVWNELGTSIEIKIKPPIWSTWWAYCLYITIFFLLIAALINFKFKRQKEIFNNKINEMNYNNLLENTRQKTNYFINLAHETKTPLTLIKNYLEKYISKVGVNEEILVIKQNIDKLSRDMVNFLDSEKLKNGQVYYNHDQVIDFSMMIKEKIPLFRSAASNKNIKIEDDIQKDIFVKGDPYALDRVINNLIDNAIRYTNDNGVIKISLKINDNQVEFIVEDNGIGISLEQQKNLFQPFHQLSHEKRNIQGIGMGLYIVKQIIDSLDAEIEIKSEEENGSKFIVILNRHTVTPDEVIQQDLEYSIPGTDYSKIIIEDEIIIADKHNILVVEDNLKLLKFLQENLKKHYNIIIALNGQEALNKLEQTNKVDLIISDIMMDIMDGYHFFKQVSCNDEYNNIPFIFLTVKTSIDEKIKALSDGVIDYIYKPFSIDEVMMKIQVILKYNKIQKEKFRREMIKKISHFISDESPAFNAELLNQKHDQVFQSYGISLREKEVIEEIIKGNECKEIAFSLNISENTVNTHLKKIYKKCKINNRVELVNIFNNNYLNKGYDYLK